MLGTRTLLHALGAAAVVAASLSVTTAAEAARPTDFRSVDVLTGSESYVVYATTAFHRRHPEDDFYQSKSELFYVAKHGKPHRLAKVSKRGWGTHSVFQAGSMVVYADSTSYRTWDWRNLDTGASGFFSADVALPGTPPRGYATTGHVVAAAPDGWVMTRSYAPTAPEGFAPSDGFYLQHTDGSITALGTPAAGVVARDASGALVAFDGAASEAQTPGASVMNFASPGTYVSLGQPDTLMHCGSVTATRVACATYPGYPTDTAYQGIRVFDAAGRLVLSENDRCAVDSYETGDGPYALLGRGLAWVTADRHGTLWGKHGQHCDTHRLFVRTAAGRLVREPCRYSGKPVAALGGIVVGDKGAQRGSSTRLVLFTSAHHHRTVVTAR